MEFIDNYMNKQNVVIQYQTQNDDTIPMISPIIKNGTTLPEDYFFFLNELVSPIDFLMLLMSYFNIF